MIAFLVSAFLTGFVVVFVLPFAKSFLDKVPGFAGLAGNRLVQLLSVGFIVILGLLLFGALAKRIRLPVKTGVV